MNRGLQEKALSRLEENKRYSGGKEGRRYLLAGLVRCAVCRFAYTGHTTTSRGKKYHYYRCNDRKTEQLQKGPEHRGPCLSASWLEDLVWQDVKQFIENPGEVLERVKEQLKDESDITAELSTRHEDLVKRLTTKQAEKDRYVRLYAQGHLAESELETYLADLKNQTDNIKLLIESVDADLSHRREHTELARTTHAWLVTLRERIAEVEEDTAEAYKKRKQLVRLLVQGVALENDESRQTKVRITYRFDPPPAQRTNEDAGVDSIVSGIPNTTGFSDTHLHRL
jgi:site-specific DNA recombinase